ncbi:zinc finger protein [Forsythia ovata]|uniref:Zinc finger protein n=1 Tax=Forsythia ovata TaxID=205694 RepID=A0ABD1X7K8_9LAMI
MDDINVLIYYDGIWEDYCYYKGYSVVGIVIPIDYNYVVLVDLIMKELKRDPAHYDVKIQYQIVANGPIIRISGDSSVSFYKGIKKNESNPMKFLLCVDINLIPGNYDDGMALDTVLTAPNTLDSTLNMRAKYFDKGVYSNGLQEILVAFSGNKWLNSQFVL